MTKQHPSRAIAPVHAQRDGEGVLVDVHLTEAASVSGHNTGSIVAQIGSVPVPNKRYSADTCFVEYQHETIAILFGQVRLGSDELRNLLVVKITPANALGYLKMCDGISSPSLNEAAANLRLKPEALPKFSAEPRDTVSVNASIALTAISGREGCIDFYHASPFSIGAAFKSRKLALEPIVRVDVRSALVLGLIERLRSLLADIPDEVVQEVPDEQLL